VGRGGEKGKVWGGRRRYKKGWRGKWGRRGVIRGEGGGGRARGWRRAEEGGKL